MDLVDAIRKTNKKRYFTNIHGKANFGKAISLSGELKCLKFIL